MRSAVEREVKLAAWPGFTLPDLTDVLDGVDVVALPVRNLDAVYWDTDDLRVTRAGMSIRHRKGDPAAWTVKLPKAAEGATLVRRELSFEGAASSPPEEAVALVAAAARSSALRPAARLRTVRRGVELRAPDGERLAEVVDDEVTVVQGRRVAARFREIEAEVPEGAPAGLLDALVRRLRQAGAGEPDPTPKVVRALGPAALAPPDVAVPTIDADTGVADAIRAAIAASVSRILAHDAGVRLGDDPEDVHQARVGTRRLRSDLRTFRPVLDLEWSEPLRQELSWYAALLGDVRDTDVLLERLTRQIDTLAERDAAGAAVLVRTLVAHRDEARATLLAAMRDPRYLSLLERLVDAANAPVLAADVGGPAADALPDIVVKPWKHLRDAVDALPDDPEDEALHEVRIRAKRCRYAAEAVAPVVGKDASRFARAVAGVQTVLGDHQDAVVFDAWLREAADRDGSAPVAFVAGELVAIQRADAARLRAQWPGAWAEASRGRLRRWMP